MKFGKLTLLCLAAAQGKKGKKQKKPKLPKPTYQDCVNEGIAADIVGNHNLSCRGHKCSIKCASGLELVGGKKVECRRDKNDPERLYIHPAKVPKCTTCTPLEELIEFEDYKISTKIKKKGPEYTLQCNDQVNILPFNMFYLSAKCFCDKKKGECFWQGQGKLNIQAQISKMRCETNEEEKVDDNDLEDLNKRPLQITPGLTCGKSNDRIVGGVEAEEHSWPWIVQLKYHSDPTVKAGHTCSGTIVADNIIVTAAHCCAAFKDLKKLTGVVAEHSVINHIDDAYYIKFERKIMHPEYKSWTLENDICLLVPKERLTLESRPEFDQPKTARACLPRQNESNPPSSTHCWTAGWGRLSFKGQLANVLNEVHVKLIDDKQCANSNTGSILHLSSQKCAGHLEGGMDACQGDSGGPLICAENGQPVLRGIVSGGIGCALPNNAGIYTRIEKYIKWINMYQVLSRSDIRAKKHALMAQRSNFVSTHREAHRLLFHLVSEGKLEY